MKSKKANTIISVDDVSQSLELLAESKPSKKYIDKQMGSDDYGFDRPPGKFRTATFTIRPDLDCGEDGYDFERQVDGSPIPGHHSGSDAELFEALMNKILENKDVFVLNEGYPKEHWGQNGCMYIIVQWFELEPGVRAKAEAKKNGLPTSVGEVL